MKALGVVFSNIHDKYVSELTRSRTMASVPFGGRYRLIDFVLSAMVNSNIDKVGVITKYNYQSLMDHIGSGKDWDLSRRNGGVIMLPPFGGVDSNSLYKTRLEALKGIVGFLLRSTEDYVVMTDCDKVINIDYSDVLRFHEKNNADITVVYKQADLSTHTSQQNIVYQVDDRDRITEVMLYPSICKAQNICQNIFVLKRQLLINLVSDAVSNNYQSFHRDILQHSCSAYRIMGYRFTGYARTIDSLFSYYQTNMDMLTKENLNNVFGIEDRPIFTKVRDSAPTKYLSGCHVSNSLIADGCEILGTVENSILFRGVRVARSAVVRNSILMQDTMIGEHSTLNCVISDKNVYVKDRRELSGCPELPYYIGKGLRI